MSRHQPPYRTIDDRRFTPPPAQPEADEVGRTAQQVRLDYKYAVVHKLQDAWTDPLFGATYQVGCGETLTKSEGALLTTRNVDCCFCWRGEKRPGL